MLAVLLATLLTLATVLPARPALAEPQGGTSNRFNVVFVVDASGSMTRTDPDGYRFEALQQFSGLLAEQGNYVGSVVFNEAVISQEAVTAVNSLEQKEQIVSQIASVPADGDTNIGEALQAAIDMIDAGGNKDLPSVIILLSDGNTDLASSDALKASLEKKADAIQDARQAGIAIYSVCLNVNGSADVSEMQQISGGTGGEFQEVKTAEDLRDVFNAFYALIYGTSTVQLVDETFSSSGIIETPFDVPAIGVEEVNIVIYGSVTSNELIDPSGAAASPSVTSGNTFTMIKLTDVTPGHWVLRTGGVPGDRIRVNMVSNSNLGVNVTIAPDDGMLNPADTLRVSAVLTTGGEPATDTAQYEGYEAALVARDANGEEAGAFPLSLGEGGYEGSVSLPEGTFTCEVVVMGNGLERHSETLGPIVVSSEIGTEEQRNNTAPTPVSEVVEESVLLWPFRENSYSVDLATLVTDDQAEPLSFRIASTSFMDGDYSVDGTTLTVGNFSISKGAFTIVATDKWGASCAVELVVKSHNVGLIALIGIGIAVVIGLIAIGVLTYIALNKPLGGDVTINTIIDGQSEGTTRTWRRGRAKLSIFQLGFIGNGLDYGKCYVQAMGKPYVMLHTNVPVPYAGSQTKDIRVDAGYDVRIVMDDGKQLIIRLDSRISRF